MYCLLIFIFVNYIWSALPHEEYHNLPTGLKVERTYNLHPGDQTMGSLIYRRFPGLGLRPLRPRPNFPNGYQKIPESIYAEYLKIEKQRESISHESRKHLRNKLPYQPNRFKLRYFPYLQSHTINRKADSPFY